MRECVEKNAEAWTKRGRKRGHPLKKEAWTPTECVECVDTHHSSKKKLENEKMGVQYFLQEIGQRRNSYGKG